MWLHDNKIAAARDPVGRKRTATSITAPPAYHHDQQHRFYNNCRQYHNQGGHQHAASVLGVITTRIMRYHTKELFNLSELPRNPRGLIVLASIIFICFVPS